MNDTNQNNVFTVYKPVGKTPKATLDTLRQTAGIENTVPMTYAGRLDPVAEGLLVILAGDRVHDKDQFSHLDKTYEFSLLLGIGTDTHDLLGMVTDQASLNTIRLLSDAQIQTSVEKFSGTYEQSYPMYSSKTVEGMPLWQYAREGKVPPYIPMHPATITFLAPIRIRNIASAELLAYIVDCVGKVEGDFRQREIITQWQKILEKSNQIYLLVDCVVDVSSGTYIRTLCVDIGKTLGVPALAYHIKRTRVGKHCI